MTECPILSGGIFGFCASQMPRRPMRNWTAFPCRSGIACGGSQGTMIRRFQLSSSLVVMQFLLKTRSYGPAHGQRACCDRLPGWRDTEENVMRRFAIVAAIGLAAVLAVPGDGSAQGPSDP